MKADGRHTSKHNVPEHTSDYFAQHAALPAEDDLRRAAEVINAGQKVAIAVPAVARTKPPAKDSQQWSDHRVGHRCIPLPSNMSDRLKFSAYTKFRQNLIEPRLS
jgi:hypothetical protein